MNVNSRQQIAVVICTASYHTPVPYGPFMKALNASRFEAYCPQRPTCDLSRLNVGDTKNPDFDLGPPPEGYPNDLDNAAVLHELLEQLIVREDKPVLLLGHSSGGVVASQAAIPELQYEKRRKQQKQGGVIGIFFVGAFVIPVGESVHSFYQPKDGTQITPPFVRVSVTDFYPDRQ